MTVVFVFQVSGNFDMMDDPTPLEELAKLIRNSSWKSLSPLPSGNISATVQNYSVIVQPLVSPNEIPVNNIPRLTNREQEVLEGLVEGLTQKQIALRYQISVRMVKEHIRKIKVKFNTDSISTAMYRAGELGLCKKKIE